MVTILCAGCQAKKETKSTKKGLLRLPRGWHRHHEQTWCSDCWSRKYTLRAVTFCVASPVDSNWPAFRNLLADQWGQFSAAANWMVTELYVRDTKRLPGAYSERQPHSPRKPSWIRGPCDPA